MSNQSDKERHYNPRLPAPLEDRLEYERCMAALPPDDKRLAEQLTTHADLCRFLSENDLQVPGYFVRELKRLATLPISDRITNLEQLNQELMEYVSDAGEDKRIRH